MPCRQVSTYNGATGSGQPGGGGYTTEADCLNACKEGACCEGTTCSVKPQCQCQGTGKTFKGVGTTCTGNPCGCCCVNGQTTTNTEEQCSAAGGTWKAYPCNAPSPATILLTLSLTDYGDFDFSCLRGTWVLPRNTYGSAPQYSLRIQRAEFIFYVSTTGSLTGVWDNSSCSCPDALIANGVINGNPAAVVKSPTVNCATTVTGWTGSTNVRFDLVLDGTSDDPFDPNSHRRAFTGFCEGQPFVTGKVFGPGRFARGPQCGTFTIGNPLP